MKTGPLSFGQQRLWFLHQFDPKDPSHNAGYAYRVRGVLDPDALRAAFTAVVARHDALRTRFTAQDGEPRAVVEEPEPVDVESVGAETVADAERIVAARANTPFDLGAAPPLRVTLVRLADDDHVLCVVLHHINGDGWSFNVLRDEIATHYAGQPLPELPLQYGDVVAAAGEPADPGWWIERLAGAPDLDLPTDRPRPAERSTEGGDVRFELPVETADAIRELARQSRCTPYMVLLTAYQVLLARHSGQSDFCVGTPAAGRGRPELERVVGFLSTTMVLRCDLAGDPSFGDLLRATRRNVLAALAHPDVPFEHLVGALGIERDLSRTPLYQAMFALHTHGSVAEPLPGLAAEPFPLGWHSARCDLSLDLYEQPDGSMVAFLIHSTDLFDHGTARRMADRFVHLLGSVLADPQRPVGQLELLPPQERDLLDAWNNTGVELPAVTLVDLVLDRAAADPDAVAVVAGSVVLTYRELVGVAAALAGDLRERGVGRGALVAVQTSRRAEMVVALLGVAMSGAAYVPVDPEYPAARIAYVVEDCGAALVLTDADLDHVLDAGPGQVPEGRPRPGDTAYVLYTSGSTGNPKGVVVPHRALANFLLAMRTLVGSTPRDRWLALTSLSFDISALELYLPLVTGGRVVVADAATSRDGGTLAGLIRDEGVTHVQATPSGWRVLLTGDFPRVAGLTGGEPLPLRLARELRSRTSRLVNVYGPTETTVWSTAWEVPEHPQRITVGTPIANTSVHVVDPHGAPVPIGVPGELLIGGAGVADGYLGRPELTAERFVDVPGSGRLYRTGDVVRRLPDGTLEFFGRSDDQVKLRGHRIELGEVAAALETGPGVRQAVVAVRDENLVAFYVAEQSADSGLQDALREHVARLLPGYMVPAQYVGLDALPLTPNGKVDRKALPRPGDERRTAGGRPPRTEAEKLVAEVFAEVLDAEDVRADDDFFALGGHSLRAAMLTARLGARTGAVIPMGDVFRHPVVEELAALVEAAVPGTVSAPVPRPAGTQAPLSFAQERLWFLARLDPQDASYNMWLAKRLRGPLDEAALRGALDAVTARHEILRTRFPEVDGAPAAVVEPPRPVPVELLRAADENAAFAMVSARTNTPLDLGAAPPLRASLIRIADDDHVVCLVMHHILGDGWSLNILYDELAALYSGRELPPLPVQFGDIAIWQRGQDSAGQLDYWQRRLADPAPLALPVDRPRAAVPKRSGGITALRLDERETAALARLGREHRCTLFMVLLAAYQAVLARHTGGSDILVGTVTAGRDRLELEPAIGYLTDVLVLRGDLAADPTVAELLDRTRGDVLDAFAHQGIPFEELAAQLRVVRDPSRTPLFQTMAILHTQGADHDEDAFAGMRSTAFDGGFQQAKFDLMLEAWQDGPELLLSLVYDAELFDAATVTRLTERFGTLLRSLPEHTATPFSAIPILTPEDTAALEGPPLGETPSVPDLFAAAVRERPDAVALSCGERLVTYAELDARAAELAAGLPRGGVVGIRLGRSVDAIAAMLAAWRAGSAYLPLDPEYPEQRLAFMAQDSGASVVLTPEAPQRLTSSTAADAAYVIYTSGSTGVPKGVAVGHPALAARVAWMREAYELRPGDRIVQFASLSFDTHVEEVFPALAAGARIDLLPEGAITLTDHLDGVTVLDLPTAYWHHLVDEIDRIDWPDTLRLVVLGGEQVHEAAVARWRGRFGDRVRLVNTYGPTEATVIATAAELTGGGRPPIGRPIGGTRIVLLGPHGEAVPPGSPGELCIGGAGLADGYLGRPDLTAERFTEVGGHRMYRSGDRARLRPDGQLEFLGRLDDQVKLRGFRIEPGEIEARLGGRGAVAVHGETLVGYTVGDPAPLAEELRAALPPHLVPAVWVELDALPLTPGGKLDRAALPAPARTAAAVAPRTDAEVLVAEVFTEVLAVPDVGAMDDFFTLGGHSLLAVKVIARLRAATDVDLPIRTLFDHGTVAGVAQALEDALLAEIDQLTEAEADRLLAESRDVAVVTEGSL
ncbi:amino acid adenylation domain-containing protein [Streptomyces cocklensis]|uniref:Amino acid adenylation domain-containing protein n=1 Tax=Actinacidiphila cocklensis TaxID=887465 RepID=A0A9W4DX52_9ACTN|nr:non-ribosomal peptide synthetase [Actinacidiphila cocklensis]MDD1063085.1 amino acid adenylation domain-containing protein [Actinacidiphila cocklensis]CAG6395522.1 Amino acid adenylation domain-containing protein [Actinacidiphila cocklensis]